MRRIRARHLVSIAVLALAGVALPVNGAAIPARSAAGGAPGAIQRPARVSNIDYLSNHPRLLYTQGEIPALYAKVRDGGYDDTAYSFIRLLIQYIYPGASYEELLDGYFAVSDDPDPRRGERPPVAPRPGAPREGAEPHALHRRQLGTRLGRVHERASPEGPRPRVRHVLRGEHGERARVHPQTRSSRTSTGCSPTAITKCGRTGPTSPTTPR